MGRGGTGDKGSARQVHKNRVKYDPNRYKDEKDRLSADVLFSMTSLCCRRCCDIIRWKTDYGKYVSLDRPHKCNLCQGRTIVLAYHHICQPCAEQHRRCAKCQKSPLTALQGMSEPAEEEHDSESDSEVQDTSKVSLYAFVDQEPLEEQLKPLQGLDIRLVRKKLLAMLAAEEKERLKFLRERERRTVVRKAKGNGAEVDAEGDGALDSDDELL